MNERTAKRLLDAHAAVSLPIEITRGFDADRYLSDHVIRLASERLLEIAGEALSIASREDPALRAVIPDLSFAIAMRHKIIHGYDHISDEAVWDTIVHDIPRLLSQLDDAMKNAPPLD